MRSPDSRVLTRRELLRLAGMGTAVLTVGQMLSACTPAAPAAGPTTSPAGTGTPTGAPGSTPAASATPAGDVQRGGQLRVGIVGGSASDTLDAHIPVTHPDQARVISLYDTLATYDPDFRIELALAEEITPSADAQTWTIRLRDGLEFHNGKDITAEDVAFSIRRVADPDDPKVGAVGFGAIDLDAIEILDPRTLRLSLTAPDAVLEEQLAQYVNGVVPVDYDPAKPVGSGPFMLSSFTPGEQSLLVRHPNYWRDEQPYLDELAIINFPDDTARVNALLSGQVDAIDQLPLAQIEVVSANPDLRVLESQTGSWLPFTMRVDRPPFDDPRVREAMRLVVDREEMVQQVLGGHGAVGNDLYAPFDPCYASDLPQRTQDIERAKQLLAEAGQEGLTVELVTAPVAAGLVEAAQVYAAQAAEAGITVEVRRVDSGEFYGDNYLVWDFAQDFWFSRNYLPQTAAGSLPDSPFNETHWAHPEFIELVAEGRATVDEQTRCQLLKEAQRIEYEEGGYIIWGFPNQVDAHSAKVNGLVPDRGGIPLTSYGFRRAWLSG